LYDYLEAEAEKKLAVYGVFVKEGIFLQEDLFQEPKVLVLQVLRKVIEKVTGSLKDISRDHLQAVYELAGKEVGKMIQLPYEVLAKKEYTGIWMGKLADKCSSFANESAALEVVAGKEVNWNDLCISAKIVQGNKEEIPEKIYTKWLDYDKMNCNLVLRYREKVDYIVVNQQGGKKKLKDYFIDIKLPQEERNRVPLLCRGQEVLWVVGHRIGESCKITEQTKNIIEIQIRGGKYHE
jgi:tRNA(Ile)-lysidine synthase